MSLLERTDSGDATITAAVARAHARVDDSFEDVLITKMLDAVRFEAESYGSFQLALNTYTLTVDTFVRAYDLPRRDVKAVTSVTYEVAGTPTAVTSSIYTLTKGLRSSCVELAPEQSWPTDGDEADGDKGTIVITFTAGPIEAHKLTIIEQGMLQHFAYLYEHRGDEQQHESGTQLDKATRAQAALSVYTSGASDWYDRVSLPRV